MLADIIDVLADPIDGSPLRCGDSEWATLKSESGHSYDVARQGYVTLAGGAGLRYSGDDAKMIGAREEFLSGGHYAPFVEAVTGNVQDVLDDAGVAEEANPAILEIGAGTGYYLAHTLDGVDGARGVGIDVSV
ncbi:MAG: SAM-dependent methyltransferase, partial [Corynebacterium sp.]|nr:SAM-dependent methyltransferase [Corynebacterium sp.]